MESRSLLLDDASKLADSKEVFWNPEACFWIGASKLADSKEVIWNPESCFWIDAGKLADSKMEA